MVSGGGLGALGVGYGLVNEFVELVAVDDFNERRALAVVGDDPDGGGVLNANALAQGVVGLDGGGELALGVDGEGHCDAMIGREFLGEVGHFGGVFADGGLGGKDFVTVVVAEFLRLGV